jgi:iron complex outermembrane receptor protein
MRFFCAKIDKVIQKILFLRTFSKTKTGGLKKLIHYPLMSLFMRFLLLTTGLFVISISIHAQNILKGNIKDENEGHRIAYVQIIIYCSEQVQMSDVQGNFNFTIPVDTCEVEFNAMGYNALRRKVIFTPQQKVIDLNVKLSPTATMLDMTSVTASKYETNPEKSTTSITVLKPKIAEDRNLTTMDGLLNTAAGVAVVDNEPQIRGGSGFSSGMGSRVLILLDDMPLLRPDAGRPMWTFIPMEDVEQVDILKGASSVVFGSTALTGAINVHTAYPRTKPKTKVILYAGMYGDPNPFGKQPYETGWTGNNPIKTGLNFLHSRIIKNNFDFIIGGEFFYDQGYIGPQTKVSASRDTAHSSSIGKYDKRARLNFATRYRFKKAKGLSVSLNGNFMYSDNAQSFFWYDAYQNRYRTYNGSMSQFNDFTFYVDPVITYTGAKGFVHSFRNRIIFSDNKESTGTQDASSISVFDEYQFTKNIHQIGMKIVAGMMNNYAISKGVVFNGEMSSNEKASMYSDNFAFYTQLEQRFLKKRNLIVEAGIRWEFYKLNKDKPENKPVFRAGINYQFPNWKTSLRTSFGQGYRYPSIGEKYIAISVGRYGFYPNPDLKSEHSWNVELGIMQPFMLFDFRGMFDIALFNQEYDNYIEFAMGVWGRDKMASIMDRIGFKYLNIGKARIQGIDFTFAGEGKISRFVNYTLSVGYTFSHPVTLDPTYVYYTDTATKREFTFLDSSYDTTRNVLKYRIEHMFKADIAFIIYKKWILGVSFNYYSAMKNVDQFFFTYDVDNPKISDMQRKALKSYGDIPFKGYYNYYYENLKGAMVWDARIGYSFSKLSISFIVKNLFNNSYALRPMYIEPPRTYTLQLMYQM